MVMRRPESRIVKKALEEPIRLIAANSGLEGAVVLDNILKGEGDYGFDAEAEKYGSMFQMGIMDPAKVTRAAVENAVSVAGMILTTESLVSDIPRKEPPMPPMPPGGGMDF